MTEQQRQVSAEKPLTPRQIKRAEKRAQKDATKEANFQHKQATRTDAQRKEKAIRDAALYEAKKYQENRVAKVSEAGMIRGLAFGAITNISESFGAEKLRARRLAKAMREVTKSNGGNGVYTSEFVKAAAKIAIRPETKAARKSAIEQAGEQVRKIGSAQEQIRQLSERTGAIGTVVRQTGQKPIERLCQELIAPMLTENGRQLSIDEQRAAIERVKAEFPDNLALDHVSVDDLLAFTTIGEEMQKLQSKGVLSTDPHKRAAAFDALVNRDKDAYRLDQLARVSNFDFVTKSPYVKGVLLTALGVTMVANLPVALTIGAGFTLITSIHKLRSDRAMRAIEAQRGNVNIRAAKDTSNMGWLQKNMTRLGEAMNVDWEKNGYDSKDYAAALVTRVGLGAVFSTVFFGLGEVIHDPAGAIQGVENAAGNIVKTGENVIHGIQNELPKIDIGNPGETLKTLAGEHQFNTKGFPLGDWTLLTKTAQDELTHAEKMAGDLLGRKDEAGQVTPGGAEAPVPPTPDEFTKDILAVVHDRTTALLDKDSAAHAAADLTKLQHDVDAFGDKTLTNDYHTFLNHLDQHQPVANDVDKLQADIVHIKAEQALQAMQPEVKVVNADITAFQDAMNKHDFVAMEAALEKMKADINQLPPDQRAPFEANLANLQKDGDTPAGLNDLHALQADIAKLEPPPPPSQPSGLEQFVSNIPGVKGVEDFFKTDHTPHFGRGDDHQNGSGGGAAAGAETTRVPTSINALFPDHNPNFHETHTNVGNSFDHFQPSGHPEDASDKLLGSWQGNHTAFSADASGHYNTVEFYGTYPGSQEFIQINGHYYVLDPGSHTMHLGNDGPVILHPVDGSPDVKMTQDSFLHLVGYRDAQTIQAASIVNQTYQEWAHLQHPPIIGTGNASDRLAQIHDQVWLAKHPGFEKLLQDNLAAKGLSTNNVHFSAVMMGEGKVDGTHLTVYAHNGFVDTNNFKDSVDMPKGGLDTVDHSPDSSWGQQIIETAKSIPGRIPGGAATVALFLIPAAFMARKGYKHQKEGVKLRSGATFGWVSGGVAVGAAADAFLAPGVSLAGAIGPSLGTFATPAAPGVVTTLLNPVLGPAALGAVFGYGTGRLAFLIQDKLGKMRAGAKAKKAANAPAPTSPGGPTAPAGGTPGVGARLKAILPNPFNRTPSPATTPAAITPVNARPYIAAAALPVVAASKFNDIHANSGAPTNKAAKLAAELGNGITAQQVQIARNVGVNVSATGDVVGDAARAVKEMQNIKTDRLDLTDKTQAELFAKAIGVTDIVGTRDAIVRTSLAQKAAEEYDRTHPTNSNTNDRVSAMLSAMADHDPAELLQGETVKTSPTIALMQAQILRKDNKLRGQESEILQAFESQGYSPGSVAVAAAFLHTPPHTSINPAQERVEAAFKRAGVFNNPAALNVVEVAAVAGALDEAFKVVNNLALGGDSNTRADNINAVIDRLDTAKNHPFRALMRAILPGKEGATNIDKLKAVRNHVNAMRAAVPAEMTTTVVQKIRAELENIGFHKSDIDRIFGAGATSAPIDKAAQVATATGGENSDRIIAGLNTLPTTRTPDEIATALVKIRESITGITPADVQKAIQSLNLDVTARNELSKKVLDTLAQTLVTPPAQVRDISEAAQYAIAASGLGLQTGEAWTPGDEKAKTVATVIDQLIKYNNAPVAGAPQIPNIAEVVKKSLDLTPDQAGEVAKIMLGQPPTGENLGHILTGVIPTSITAENFARIFEIANASTSQSAAGLTEVDINAAIPTALTDIAKKAVVYSEFLDHSGTTAAEVAVNALINTAGTPNHPQDQVNVVRGLMLAHQSDDDIAKAMKAIPQDVKADVIAAATFAVRFGASADDKARLAVLGAIPKGEYAEARKVVQVLEAQRPAVEPEKIRAAMEILGFDLSARDAIATTALTENIGKISKYVAPTTGGKNSNEGTRGKIVEQIQAFVKDALMVAGYPDLTSTTSGRAKFSALVGAVINGHVTDLNFPTTQGFVDSIVNDAMIGIT